MNGKFINVLLVEDNLGDAELLQDILEEATAAEFNVTHVTRLSDAFQSLSEDNFDVILLDLSLPDSQGIETLMELQARIFHLPILVLTGLNDEQLAVAAVREGAQDYLLKGQVTGALLGRAIRYAIERKTAEITIRSSLDRERELAELKSRFVSMISHELRSPLTTILAAADLLEKFSTRLTEDKKTEMHKRVKNAAARMNLLLDDILAIWRTESAEQPFIPVLMDLIEFCRNLVEEFRSQIADLASVDRGSDRTITFISSSSSCAACMDRTLLRQILSNLLSNAIKYSPAGTEVKFELLCHGSYATFRIHDRGIGIPAKDREKLFTTFYRASNTSTIPGTGLGLAIVKKSVELHDGTITVDSEVEVGSTFTVTLPLSPTRIPNESVPIEENASK